MRSYGCPFGWYWSYLLGGDWSLYVQALLSFFLQVVCYDHLWFPPGGARGKSDSLWVQGREPCGSEREKVNLKGFCQKITRCKLVPSTTYAQGKLCVLYLVSFSHWSVPALGKGDSRRAKWPFAVLPHSLCICRCLFFFGHFRISVSNSAKFCHLCWESY